jgi:hypothetical protein
MRKRKKTRVREFNFLKGLAVVIFAGVMGTCFAYKWQLANRGRWLGNYLKAQPAP